MSEENIKVKDETDKEIVEQIAKVTTDIQNHNMYEGRKGFLTEAVVEDFKNQYPSLLIKSNSHCHDRWIIIDYGLATEQVYHCGASSKDAGKKFVL